jgi:predicted transcriptional regulator
MEVHIAPDLQEKLEHSAAKQGRDADELVQEALARYLADEERYLGYAEGWTDDERLAAMSHIEEGFLQAERGELIDGDQARREIQVLQDAWRQQRQSAR